MAIFIRLINLTEQGARNMDNLPKMVQDARNVMKKHNTKVLNLYTTLGNYDLVAIIDAPDAMTAAKVSAEIAAQGNFRAETLAAVSMEEFLEGAVGEV
ncbi:MAG: GYD domain-containing protein [Calditrichaeota bacterium]|nr:MAG: GYD domain-containing protein [Calditrichota bacterium]